MCKSCKSEPERAKGLCRRCYQRKWAAERRKSLCVTCNRRVQNGPSGSRECKTCHYGSERLRESQRSYYRDRRRFVIDSLGGVCWCCGEFRLHLLTLDHIHGDGAEHRRALRKQLGYRGDSGKIYYDVIKEGIPKDRYRVACWNCNSGSRNQQCHSAEDGEKLRKFNEQRQ